MPQLDRSEVSKVPLVPWIGPKVFEDKSDGYRDEEMPPQAKLGDLAWLNKSNSTVLFVGTMPDSSLSHYRGWDLIFEL